MQFVKAPLALQWIYPGLTWHKARDRRDLFLTFDDGPIPNVTEEILDLLQIYGVKATFFCVGENVARHSKIFERLLAEGHQVGNHTYNHLDGWKTPTAAYLSNVQRCQELTCTRLFRPPYSKMKPAQIARLRSTHEIVLWDVLSRDFDPRVSPEQCLKNVVQHAQNGSIIVFHDHVKAIDKVRFALPRAIEFLLASGYKFRVL